MKRLFLSLMLFTVAYQNTQCSDSGDFLEPETVISLGGFAMHMAIGCVHAKDALNEFQNNGPSMKAAQNTGLATLNVLIAANYGSSAAVFGSLGLNLSLGLATSGLLIMKR
ncbi:MAG: hypothetical protein NTZ68_03015 [Candidatus Dependentiae bacterium]|nr:hypothetical protein [Candidatus Dependentiae bacterium]